MDAVVVGAVVVSEVVANEDVNAVDVVDNVVGKVVVVASVNGDVEFPGIDDEVDGVGWR